MPRRRKVLVVGSGGREHALARRLLESESVGQVIVSPGNPGTARAPEGFAPDALCNAEGPAVELALREAVDLVVVGPEAPLVAGLVDELAAAGVLAFGPSRDAARLEGSKVFMKDFAERHGLRTARHVRVSTLAEAERAIGSFAQPPVVKADGLCAGKGVIVAPTHEAALEAARDMLESQVFGAAGATVVVEERLEGAEASVHAITDGESLFVMASAQDHKRIGEGDTGLNTGGMGAYAPAPLVTPKLAARVAEEVVQRAVAGMRTDGTPYRGVLYAGLMISPGGDPYLLEFNVRFGDPETQVLMNTIDGDLAEALATAANGRLDRSAVANAGRHAMCVVLAASGYPGAPVRGDVISGLAAAESLRDVRIYHAGTRLDEGGRLVTSGGRVLGVTAAGETLHAARDRAYEAADLIDFRGRQLRRDIGWRALA